MPQSIPATEGDGAGRGCSGGWSLADLRDAGLRGLVATPAVSERVVGTRAQNFVRIEDAYHAYHIFYFFRVFAEYERVLNNTLSRLHI